MLIVLQLSVLTSCIAGLDLVCVVSNAGGVEAGYSVSTAGYKTEPHLKEVSVPSWHQCAEDTSHPTAQNRVF